MQLKYDNGLIIITGAVKSGKSRLAEKIMINKENVIYIATHNHNDTNEEWNKRIHIHQSRRPKDWKLIESSDISIVIENIENTSNVLIDSLGGVVANYIEYTDDDWNNEKVRIIQKIDSFKGLIVIVAEEVGWGVSPSTYIGNIFRDRLGQLTEEINIKANASWLMLHGRAINITKNSFMI